MAPTPRKTFSTELSAHTHVGCVMPAILAKASSSTKTCAQDWSVLPIDARLVWWSKVTASVRPSWSIAMVETTGAAQKVKGEEAPREASARDTTATATSATPRENAHASHAYAGGVIERTVRVALDETIERPAAASLPNVTLIWSDAACVWGVVFEVWVWALVFGVEGLGIRDTG